MMAEIPGLDEIPVEGGGPSVRMPTAKELGLYRNRQGQLCHRRTIRRSYDGGETWHESESERPVAMTLEEAQAKRWDYYHPTLGWIWEGYKRARDETVESKLSDSTIGGIHSPIIDAPLQGVEEEDN